jgi:hypothetical protein
VKDEQLAAKLAELQAERGAVAATRTPEDARDDAEGFVKQTRAFFLSQTPPQSVVGGGVLAPGQRLDIALAYVVGQPGFVDFLVAEAQAAGAIGELERKAKAKRLAELDKQIEKLRREQGRRKIAAAKAEAEAEVARLDAALAAEKVAD